MPDIEIPQGAEYDITIFQGGTYARTFRFSTKNPVTGVLTRKPLAGYLGEAQVRSHPGGDLFAEFDVDVNQSADPDDEDCGRIDVSMAPAISAAILLSGSWDLAVFNDAGHVIYVIQGKAVLDRRVTIVEDDGS